MQQYLFSLNDLLEAVSEATNKGYKIGFDQISGSLAMYHPHLLPFPAPVASAIIQLLKTVDSNTLLNPWERFGEVLLPILEQLPSASALAICQQRDQVDFLEAMRLRAGFNVHADLGRSAKSAEFDVIIGIPSDSVLRDDNLSDEAMFPYFSLLKPEGHGIVAVPRGVFTKSGKKSPAAKLKTFGCSVHAILQWSPELRFGSVSIDLDLVIIKPGIHEDIFVGELVSDAAVNKVLIANYLNWRGGSSVELGRIIRSSEFVSLEQIVQTEKLSALAIEWGCSIVPLANIASEVRRLTEASEPEGSNSIFVPAIGESPVVCSVSDLTLKWHNYIRVDLNEELAINGYIAHFLNTQLGRALRKASKSGIFIPKLSNSRLPNIHIPLLPVDVQLAMINAQSLIANQRAHLAALEASIWQSPQRIESVTRELTRLNEEDSFEDWAETLPFPLASIAWTYHIADSDRDKFDRLIHFFEATAELLSTVFLSAFALDDNFYKAHCDQWINRNDKSYQNKFIKSSFGSWAILSSKLAGAMRKAARAEGESALLFHFFDVDQEFLDTILNKTIYTLLNDVVEKRNSWLGHTGIVNDEQYYRRRVILEADLAKLRELLGPRLKKVQFVLPDACRFSQGQYKYKARLLQGTHSEFRLTDICTSSPMEESQLYFVYESSQKPLKLLPFVKLCPSPATQNNACYFYNRATTEGEARFVSYHFAGNSEIELADEAVKHALSLLRYDYGIEAPST
jgi:hypothetical protein